MSDYTGPGIYEIVPYHVQTLSLNVWNGDKHAGTEVKLYQRDSTAENTQFEIVAAGGTKGKPELGDREYHIIAVNSGLYVSTNTAEKITTELRSPRHASVRWKIVYAGNGAYYLNNIDGQKQLNVRGSGKESGTDVIGYSLSQTSNAQFLLKSV